MGKFDRVRYVRINRMSLEIACNLGDGDKAKFLDQILSWFLQLERGEELIQAETENPVLNLALREALGELETGYEQYMRNVRARKSADEPEDDQRVITDTPVIEQRSTTDEPVPIPSDQNQTFRKIRERLTEKQIDQIKSDLRAAGYSAAEIDNGLDRVTDQNLSNPTGYIRRILDNARAETVKRPTGKTVSAQQYTQRPYESEEDEAVKKFIADARAAAGF